MATPKKISRRWLIISSLIIVVAFWFYACSSTQNKVDAQTKIASELNDSFQLSLPVGFKNVKSSYFSYWSMDGGTKVYLQLLEGDHISAAKLLETLDEKHVTVASHIPIEDRNANRNASWWHPEKYGQGDIFKLANNNEKRPSNAVIFGYLANTSSNSVLFLQMRESPR